jgi:glycosyltransferase involved in cell wall biosynthesis
MKFSCIMTTFNDGALIRQSIASILNQTHEDWELVIVDDGSGTDTQALLEEFTDPRIRVLPQANDGLSSARNRGLGHVCGDYVCFLDADDTRAPWAFAEVAQIIERTGSELVLVRGVFSGERTPLEPFYDEGYFDEHDAALAADPELSLAERKAWAAALEPQSANKFIARSVIERGKLRFPNDHFYEDILFHAMAVAHARSITLSQSRNFTYFQRQLRAQLTGAKGQMRFDILGTARVTLQVFAAHPDFHNTRQRSAIMLSVLRLVNWCENTISTYHAQAYRSALRELLRGVDPLYLAVDKDVPDPRGERVRLMEYAKGAIS